MPRTPLQKFQYRMRKTAETLAVAIPEALDCIGEENPFVLFHSLAHIWESFVMLNAEMDKVKDHYRAYIKSIGLTVDHVSNIAALAPHKFPKVAVFEPDLTKSVDEIMADLKATAAGKMLNEAGIAGMREVVEKIKGVMADVLDKRAAAKSAT